MLDDGLRMLGLFAVANRRREKRETLAEASGHLDALRITVRLGKRLGYVSHPGYGRLSEQMDEVGRMLGGWLNTNPGPRPRQRRPPRPSSTRYCRHPLQPTVRSGGAGCATR